MSPTLTFDISPLLGQIKRASELMDRDIRDMVRQQATLFVYSSNAKTPGVINITPPFSQGVMGKKAFDQGAGAIRRDLFGGQASQKRSGIFFPLADSLIDSALDTGVYQTENVRLFVKKSGEVYGAEKSLFKPSATTSDFRSHHKRYFRNGRMTSAGGRTRDIGRWKFVDKLVVRKSDAEAYFEEQKRKIGWAAAAWYMAAIAAGLSPRGVPAWIRRHSSASGYGSPLSSGKKSSITLISYNSYNGGLEMDRKARIAMGYRENALKRQMPYLVRAALKKAGMRAA